MAEPRDAAPATDVLEHDSDITLQRCKVVQVSGSERGREVILDAAPVVFGSASECDVVLGDTGVSRRHFKLAPKAQGFVVQDLDSTNGTFLDGVRVTEAFVRPGMTLRAGGVELRVESTVERVALPPSSRTEFHGLVGVSTAVREIFAMIERIAPSDTTVLLQGETGTGKTAFARAVHEASPRAAAPFVVVDCGAIAPTLVESELFGHERGAFTGAVQRRVGAFEFAAGGTVFIDELTELPLALQPRLLRVLEEREITRVGSQTPQKVNCRIVAASQKNLKREVDAGRFRSDLYFRLAVVTVPLPALRERKDDIPLLVDRFLSDIAPEGARFDDFDADLRRRLVTHGWPGNLRELRNSVERITLLWDAEVRTEGGVAKEAGLALARTAFETELDRPYKEAKDMLLNAFERSYMENLLQRTGRSISEVARRAGLDRKHIHNLLAKHGLGRPNRD